MIQRDITCIFNFNVDCVYVGVWIWSMSHMSVLELIPCSIMLWINYVAQRCCSLLCNMILLRPIFVFVHRSRITPGGNNGCWFTVLICVRSHMLSNFAAGVWMNYHGLCFFFFKSECRFYSWISYFIHRWISHIWITVCFFSFLFLRFIYLFIFYLLCHD